MKYLRMIHTFFFRYRSRCSPVSEAVSEAFKESFREMGYSEKNK